MSEGTGCLTGSSGFGGALVVVAMVLAKAVKAVMLEKLESLLTEPRASSTQARAAYVVLGDPGRSVSGAASLRPTATVNVAELTVSTFRTP